MREQFDLVFVGNTSLDKKICMNGKYVEVIGGSAFNAYSAALSVRNSLKCKLCTNLNKDKSFISTIFNINEITGICNSIIGSQVELNEQLICKHLHISFRQGVNVDSFLDNTVKFNSLSIDVMINSIDKYKRFVKKYAKLIDFLFCNQKEYEFIKDIEINGVFIVTNEEKPIKVCHKERVEYYYVPPLKKLDIVSLTGAGDSFIGGFLKEYLFSKNLLKSIKQGVACSQSCLKTYTNEKLSLKNIHKNENVFKFPDKIIIIGPSCAGKSTLVKRIVQDYDFYRSYDDLGILQERVRMDCKNTNDKQLRFYKNHVNLLNTQKTIKTSSASFKIIDDSLWTEVIDLLCENCNGYSIIEFSRGTKNRYEKKNVYIPYIKTFKEKFNSENLIYLFVDERYKNRYKRNIKREKNGGHKVDENTFRKVYHYSCYPKSNSNFIKIKSNIKLRKLMEKIGGKL